MEHRIQRKEVQRSGSLRLPEGVKGNIGLIIRGYIDIPADGVYTFALMSDDGSWLKIDGNMVVDNDREQSPHEEVCQQALRKGLHRVEVRYFDHNGGLLRLKVTDSKGNFKCFIRCTIVNGHEFRYKRVFAIPTVIVAGIIHCTQ